jgi:hypothetical protein
MLLPILREAFACRMHVTRTMIFICATGLSSVNHVYRRECLEYAAFRRLERPRTY